MPTKKSAAKKATISPTQEVDIAPVVGRFINGVPAVPQTLPHKEAEKLVATGAFAFASRPRKAAEKPDSDESTVAEPRPDTEGSELAPFEQPGNVLPADEFQSAEDHPASQ